MSRVTIRRKHKLGHAELLERVSHLADRLGEKYGADIRWEGETVHIEHSNVTGKVHGGPADIRRGDWALDDLRCGSNRRHAPSCCKRLGRHCCCRPRRCGTA